MTQLERGFETKARLAFIQEIEDALYDEPDNLTFQFTQRVEENLRAFGQRHDLTVEPIIESMVVTEAERTLNGARARVEWQHEAAGFFEFGVSPHRISGNPILSFVWEDPPAWVREEFDQARGGGGQFESGWRVFFPEVQHPGMPESRAIRDAIHWLRREIQS